MLSADDVRFAYRRGSSASVVLDGVTVTIAPRSIVGILGPNGSGKTTLLRLLAGVLRADAGVVRLGGLDIRQLPRHVVARRLAIVPQETHPAFDYTVLEMVLMGRYPHLGAFEVEGPADLHAAREALRATGSMHLEQRLFHTLSGGEKQRVVIAAAVAQAGDLLLLDEPTASLDLGYRLEITALIRRLNAESGVTVVLSTHDLDFAAATCDRLVLLRDGRVLESGRPAEVITPAALRRLYDVDVSVICHEETGRLVVVPAHHADERPH